MPDEVAVRYIDREDDYNERTLRYRVPGGANPPALERYHHHRGHHPPRASNAGGALAGGAAAASSAAHYLGNGGGGLMAGGGRWLCPDLLRFGASSLLGDIERQLEHHISGRYSAAYRHALA